MVSKNTTKRHRLGQLLVSGKVVTEKQLEEALEYQRQMGNSLLLGEVLVRLNLCSENQITEVLAHGYGVPYARISPRLADPKVIDILPKEFLEKHPELKENPATEWLKQFPAANAQLAVWGQAKIYTKKAYDEFNKLVRELDIPDSAIPELTLPPKGSVDNYFKYQELIANTSANSWETQLLLLEDDDLRTFIGRQPIETSQEVLELKIASRDFDAESQEYKDNQREIEALENNGSDFKDDWVARGKVVDEFGGSSSEATIWLLDNPETYDWAIANNLLEDRKAELLEREELLRLNVEITETKEGSKEFEVLSRKKQGIS